MILANWYLDGKQNDTNNPKVIDAGQFSEAKYNGHAYAYYYVTDPSVKLFAVKTDPSAGNTSSTGKLYVDCYNNFNSNNTYISYQTASNSSWSTWFMLGGLGDIDNKSGRRWTYNVPQDITKFKVKTQSSGESPEITVAANDFCYYKVYNEGGSGAASTTHYSSGTNGITDAMVKPASYTPSTGTIYYWETKYGETNEDVYEETSASCGINMELKCYTYYGSGDNPSADQKWAHAGNDAFNSAYYVIILYEDVDYGTINGVTVGENSDRIRVIASEVLPGQKPPVKPVTVYAKDGFIRDGYQVQSEAATTTVTKIVGPDGTKIFESAAASTATGQTAHGTASATVTEAGALITTLGTGITYTPYKEGSGDPGTWYEKITSIPKGSVISVRTVLANDKDMFAKGSPATGKSFRDTHYVKGYVCNGVTYQLHDYSSTGVYTEDITVPMDTAIDNFEITPVYYMKDDSNCKTFVIQGFDDSIKKLGWGNTLYAYPYYNGVDRMQCAFGGYPGTPLLCYGGTYMIQIPTTNDGTADGAEIRGLTLSNGYWDLQHRVIDSAEIIDHRQTYDYDDFYKIYKEKSPDNIYMSFKYRNVKNNLTESINAAHAGNANDSATAARSDFEANGNGIEDYLDALNRPIDIFGNVLSSSDLTAAGQSKLLIVSDGYAATYTGEYATDWTIFSTTDGGATYTRVTTVAPSVLYMNNDLSWNKPYTSAGDTSTVGKLGWYKSRYDALESYKHLPVEITYEKEIKNNFGDVANRLDARWLYSNNSDKINAKVKIEYMTASGTKYIEDEFVDPADPASNTGAVTGTKAYFTNFTPKNINKKTKATDFVINPEGTFDLMAEEAAGYEFVGWYVQYDGHDGENKVNKEGSLDGHSPIIGNATFVARFKEVQSGSLNVSHTVKREGAHMGYGTPYIYYTIKNEAGTVVESSVTFKDSTSFNFKNSAYIKNKYGKYKIDVYLDAVPKAGSTFDGYVQPSFPNETTDIFNLTTENVTSPISSTWAGTNLAHADFTVSNVLDHDDFSSIAYFSQFNLAETKAYKYEITYTFPTRFWGNQKYKVTGDLDEDEVEAYVTGSGTSAKLNKTFLIQNKPYESNFHQYLSWQYDDAITAESCTDVGTDIDHVYKIIANVNCEQTPDNKVYAEFVLPFGGTVSGPLTNPTTGANSDKVVYDPDAKSVHYNTDFLCLFQTDNSSLFFDDTGTTIKYRWNGRKLEVDEENGQTLEQLAAQECTNPNCVDRETGEHMCHPTIKVNEKSQNNPKWLSYYWSRHIAPTLKLLDAPDNIYKLKDSKNDFAKYSYSGKWQDFSKLDGENGIKAYLLEKGVDSDDVNALDAAEIEAIAKVRNSVAENKEYYETYVSNNQDYGMGKYYSFEPLANTTVPRTFNVVVNGKTYSIQEYWIQKYQINGMANGCNASECFDILTFTRWRVESINKSSALSKVLTYCYDEEFNFAGYEDYVVTPEYYTESEMADHLNDKNQYTTSITFLENNRNQWNINNDENPAYYNATHAQSEKSMVKADKIIADFNLSFNENGESLKGSGDVGVLIQQLQPLDDIDTGKPLTDAKQYAAKIGDLTTTEEITHLKNFIAGTDSVGSVDGILTVKGSVDSNLLSSKNRMEWSYNFNNKKVVYSDSLDTPHTDTTDRKYVYRAISYMKIGNEYYLSKTPAYFTLYDIAVK